MSHIVGRIFLESDNKVWKLSNRAKQIQFYGE